MLKSQSEISYLLSGKIEVERGHLPAENASFEIEW